MQYDKGSLFIFRPVKLGAFRCSLRRQRVLLGVAMIAIGLCVSSAIAQADKLGKTSRTDQFVARIVTTLMQRDHLSSRDLDDTISERAFDRFIKALDPSKVYFLQSDIDEFQKWKDELDDQMAKGDFSVAFEIFNRFLKRVDERTETALEMIDGPHDFSLEENIVVDPDLRSFPANEEEAREIWRKRIKYALLVLKNDETLSKAAKDSESDDANKDHSAAGTPKKKKEKIDPRERLRKRYRAYARRMHQIDTEDVVEMFITAVTSSFDPHTSYMSKGSFENFLIIMGLELEGIGATLQATDDGYTVIKNIVPGGAADRQGGLKVEDKIVAVAQGDAEGNRASKRLYEKHGGEPVDVIGMKLDDVVAMIRGEAGTAVRLSVMSENDSTIHDIVIIREKIKLEDSAAHGAIFEEGTRPDGTPLKIGVIDLPSFYASMGGKGEGRSTTHDVKKILDDFTAKGVDAVVLDLRRNGGGSLREAIDCTGLFIDIGPVVQVKDAYGNIEKHLDETPGMSWSGPLVVLTSKFSASASEILAGAVQDYHRGLVVGDTTTHGKGTVQSLINLNQIIYRVKNPPNVFGALKITMQQFYRPNGDSTQKRGVLSDLVLPSITDKMDVSESDLDYPVEFDRIPKADFEDFEMVTPEEVQALREKSNQRLAHSKRFQEEVERIKHYVEQKNLKSVTLNETKFMKRRAELRADKEDEKAFEKTASPSREIKRDYYLDEVLRITADYVKLLQQK